MNSITKYLATAALFLGGLLLLAPSAFAVNYVPSDNNADRSPVGLNGKGMVVGDFGRDEADDVIVVSEAVHPTSGGGGIYMMLNNGIGEFEETEMSACNPAEPSPCDNGWLIAGVYKADFDQDGNDDILTVKKGLDHYTVWLGDGDGHLSYGGSLSPARPLPSVNSLAIGDINQDDYPDIVVGYDGGDFGVHPNLGLIAPGSFSAATPVVQSITGAGANDKDYFGSVAIGDYNGGGVDIAFGQVACTTTGPGCTTPFPSSNAVFVADGDGSPVNFIGASGNPHPVPAGRVISDISTIQVDVGYMATGLAVGTSEGLDGEIHTYVGNTNQTLVDNPNAKSKFPTNSPPVDLTTASLNTDSLPDLAWIENGHFAGVATQGAGGSFETARLSPFDIAMENGEFSSIAVGHFGERIANYGGIALGGYDTVDNGSIFGILEAESDLVVGPDLDFGEVPVGTSATLPIEIGNAGVFENDEPGSITVKGGTPGVFEVTNAAECAFKTILPGETCSVNVKFSPQAAGDYDAVLAVQALGPDVEAGLSGSGTAAGPGPGPDPDPDPDPDPTTSARLKLSSATKVRPGGKFKVKALLVNTGNQAIDGLALSARVPKKLAKKPAGKTVKSIAPGASIKRTLVVKVRPKAKRGGKLVVKVRATVAGKTIAVAKKKVRIRK